MLKELLRQGIIDHALEINNYSGFIAHDPGIMAHRQ